MSELKTVATLPKTDSLGRKRSTGRPRKIRAQCGRPTTYTPEIGKAICKELANGLPFTMACGCAGVNEDTARGWEANGRETQTGPFAAFSRNVERARAIAVRRRMKRITASAIGGATVAKSTRRHKDGSETETTKQTAPDWKADAWILERTERETFGQHRTVDIATRGELDLTVRNEINPTDLALLSGLLAKVLKPLGAERPIILEATCKPLAELNADGANGPN